jgi:hypothetical protein
VLVRTYLGLRRDDAFFLQGLHDPYMERREETGACEFLCG